MACRHNGRRCKENVQLFRTPALLSSPLASANHETVSLWATVSRKLQLSMAVPCSVFSWRSLWGMGGCLWRWRSHTHTYTHTHTLTHPHTLTHTYTHTLIHTYSDVEVFLVGTDNTVSVERSRPSLASSYCVLTEHMLAASTCPRCPSLQALDNGG